MGRKTALIFRFASLWKSCFLSPFPVEKNFLNKQEKMGFSTLHMPY